MPRKAKTLADLDAARQAMNSDAPPEEHRASNRAELIRKSVAEIAALQAEKATLNEQIAEIKGRVKSELGMKMADFSIAIRLHQLEHEDRDSAIDTIRECFEALGIGEQGTLFPDAAAASTQEAA